MCYKSTKLETKDAIGCATTINAVERFKLFASVQVQFLEKRK